MQLFFKEISNKDLLKNLHILKSATSDYTNDSSILNKQYEEVEFILMSVGDTSFLNVTQILIKEYYKEIERRFLEVISYSSYNNLP